LGALHPGDQPRRDAWQSFACRGAGLTNNGSFMDIFRFPLAYNITGPQREFVAQQGEKTT